MEPDKTYPLHSDDASQPPSSASLPANDSEKPLEAPSKYNQSPDNVTSSPSKVPWYLQPLTKSNDSPLTSPQTRPSIPRQPSTTNRPTDPAGPNIVATDAPMMHTPTGESNRASSTEPAADTVPLAAQGTSNIQAPPMSPFRSRPTSLSTSQGWNRQSQPLSSPDRFQMPGQAKAPEYQQALAASSPKPFSQFGDRQAKQPVKNNTRKPNKFRKIFGIAVAILLVTGIGLGIFWLWRTATAPSASVAPTVVANAEDKLYQAIENNLSTSKVHQMYEQTTAATQTSTVKIDATSDFSDPRTPKSYLNYQVTTGEDDATDAAGELVVENADEYYAQLTKPALFYNGDPNVGPKENQWYSIPSNDTRSEVLMDPLGARASINSSLGEFPVGSFSEGTRQQLMQYIKDNKVYEIVSSQQVEIDGKKMTNYKLTLNIDALNELNRKVYAAVDGNSDDMPVSFTKSEKQNTELWVSDDTTKIAKIKIERQSTLEEGGQVVKETVNVTLDYPDDVSKIKKPESVKSPTWGV